MTSLLLPPGFESELFNKGNKTLKISFFNPVDLITGLEGTRTGRRSSLNFSGAWGFSTNGVQGIVNQWDAGDFQPMGCRGLSTTFKLRNGKMGGI